MKVRRYDAAAMLGACPIRGPWTVWHQLRGLPCAADLWGGCAMVHLEDAAHRVEWWRRQLEREAESLLVRAVDAASHGPELVRAVYAAGAIELEAWRFDGQPCALWYARHAEVPEFVQGVVGTWTPGTLGELVAVEMGLLAEVSGEARVCAAVVTDTGEAAVHGHQSQLRPVLPQVLSWLARWAEHAPNPGAGDVDAVKGVEIERSERRPSKELKTLFAAAVRAAKDFDSSERRTRSAKQARNELLALFEQRWRAEGAPRMDDGVWVAKLSPSRPYLRYSDVAREDLALARRLRRDTRPSLKFVRLSALQRPKPL